MATGIGETLRAARRQHGVALSDAAAETRVRESYLAALEEEDFAVLGGDVYVKGFLRSYARFLGLDPEPLLQTYREHHEQGEETAALAGQPLAAMPRDRPPMVGILAAGALLLVVLLAIIGLTSSDEEPLGGQAAAPAPVEQTEPETEPPATAGRSTGTDEPTRTEQPTETEERPETEEPTETEPPTLDLGDEVRLTFAVSGGESWIQVTVDGVTETEGLQSDGFSETFTGAEEVSVLVGNAEPSSVEVNGVDLGDLGDSGEVVTVTCTVGADECQIEPA